VILDDPVQHVDDFRALHLVETLAAIRRTGRQVICTVEDPELAKLLARRLRASYVSEGKLIQLQYVPEAGISLLRQEDIFPFAKALLRSA
jgi:ABC-type cobalamin/Fe3+-siderophores transport system ATPase subunit